MPINPIHHTWIQRILELRPGQRITQVRNFCLAEDWYLQKPFGALE